MNRSDSYTAAGKFPIKVLLNSNKIIKKGKIVPYHVQINPTNRCNLKCPFCSCSARDKNIEILTEHLLFTMAQYADMGCKAVTITGGGEPLLHPDINKIIKLISKLGIKVGLVTNGTVFNKLEDETFGHIEWCRISSSRYKEFRSSRANTLADNIVRGNNIDWAFSHVLTDPIDFHAIDIVKDVVTFANIHNFTHIRLVSDLLNVEATASAMDLIKSKLEEANIDDSLVIYQGRKEFTKGRKRCLISLLKPVVGADGGIYPCCGVQYANSNPSLDYHHGMKMGSLGGVKHIFNIQRYFDGSNCDRCYYDEYNLLLGMLQTKVEHLEHV